MKIDPYSIPSDKKRKPAQHISNLLFPVEVSQNCSAKLMVWKEMGGGKGTLNYSIFLNPDLSLDAIPPFFPSGFLDKGKGTGRNGGTYTKYVPQRFSAMSSGPAWLIPPTWKLQVFSLALAILELLQCRMKKVIVIVKIVNTSFLKWGRTTENIVSPSIIVALRYQVSLWNLTLLYSTITVLYTTHRYD